MTTPQQGPVSPRECPFWRTAAFAVQTGPEDTIYVKGRHIYCNGIRQPDFYIKACGAAVECDFPVPITISPGHWFMMGDNRGDSDDSTLWGPVAASRDRSDPLVLGNRPSVHRHLNPDILGPPALARAPSHIYPERLNGHANTVGCSYRLLR
jgi:hypothetical protein